MELLSAEVMRSLDSYAIHTLGISSDKLMSNAATQTARAALSLIGPIRTAAVFCGSGNNGGDGIGAAEYLIRRGIHVRVFLVGNRKKMTDDALKMELRLLTVGVSIETFDEKNFETIHFINHCGVIIDAIFGIGLNAPLRENALTAVKIINSSPAPVVSADIATGIEANTGRVLGDAVRADVTVTFTRAKPAHFTEPGASYTGRLIVADIGIPEQVVSKAECHVFSVDKKEISLPGRPRNAHKGDFGRVFILAGSACYTGAPVFASSAAVKSGAGLVFLGVPSCIHQITAMRCMEAMPISLPGTQEGMLHEDSLSEILSRLRQSNVCLIGPGLGCSDSVVKIVHAIIRTSDIPLILDADGINAVSKNIDILREAKCPIILTPHEGEFARLGGWASTNNRLMAARQFASQYGCTLVLKGHHTITALADGTCYLNTTGNPGMAKGGSGDILSGMIAALIGQQLSPENASRYAVYLHGLAGDICAEKYSEYCMTPSDIIEHLSQAFFSVI